MATNYEPVVEPTDLGVRIGTKKEKFFDDVRKKVAEDTEVSEYTIELNKEILKAVDRIIDREKETFK